jgi:hypothetical protein
VKTGAHSLDPLALPDWDTTFGAVAGAGVFHTRGWMAALHAAYGFRPCSVALGAAPGAPCLTLMDVRSPLTGRRGIALPFTDRCEPLPCGAGDPRGLFAAARELGSARGWRRIELRGGGDWAPGATVACRFVGHVVDVDTDDATWEARFDSNMRRNLRKAEKAGVTVEASAEWEALERFVCLNALTRRRHGLPPQPGRFFRALHRELIGAGGGTTVLARHAGRVSAAAVFLWHNGEGVFKYAASAPNGGAPGCAHSVMREGFRCCRAAGATRVDLGRTHPDNAGLRRYKRGFGGREYAIDYYRYVCAADRFVRAVPRLTGPHSAVIRALPMPLLRAVGAIVYRHAA